VRIAKNYVLAADLNTALDAATRVTDALAAWHTSRTTTGLYDLTRALNEASNVASEQDAVEVAAMDAKCSDGHWDTQSWRQ
jgi:hypothetical protein